MILLVYLHGQQCRLLLVKKSTTQVQWKTDQDLMNHHRRGGQSQNRLMRICQQSHHAYVRHIAEQTLMQVHHLQCPVIIIGSGEKPTQLAEELKVKQCIPMLVETGSCQDKAVARVQYLLSHQMQEDPLQPWLLEFEKMQQQKPTRAMYGRDTIHLAIDQGLVQHIWSTQPEHWIDELVKVQKLDTVPEVFKGFSSDASLDLALTYFPCDPEQWHFDCLEASGK